MDIVTVASICFEYCGCRTPPLGQHSNVKRCIHKWYFIILHYVGCIIV